ncbi:hypothetical protein ACFW1A_22300 [Kitasatospora sp. NPDC058965]|uniref:hypothetical protein n=1 Tax=Kitasatospora sp. NPDC058965 TaxID=3346682 RepID=UPI0036CDCAFA
MEKAVGAGSAEEPEDVRPTVATPVGHAVKVSVSMPDDLVDDIRARVGKREFSRFVAEAAAHQIAMIKLGEIVEAHEAEHGQIPDELMREAEDRWHEAFGQ